MKQSMMAIVKGFRRFHSSIVSSNTQVATEISNVASGSNVEQSERRSSKTPIRKRVNNAERKQMLESFVNRYRAMNMGKFPSPTSAQKEVGGGYYSIKKLLQEMEYNFKMSPGSQHATKENNKQIKSDNAVCQEIAMEPSQRPIDLNLCEDFDKNTDDTGNTSITTKNDTQVIATENDEKPEQKTRDDDYAFKDLESKVEKQPDGTRGITGDKGDKENELRVKASLWGGLKSLANGFISMWKK